jgi:hypothetical protein
MNSLTELNGYVNNFSLTYSDDRLANVIFDRPVPTNQSQSVDRGFTTPASVGYDIVEILNAPQSSPNYTIDVSNLAGATVTWASLPSGVTVSNPSAGVYIVNGFEDKLSWDAIKSPTIDFSDDYFGSWTYTSSISYYSVTDGAQTKSWTTAVTVNNILFWTTSTQFIYELSAVSTIIGEPLLGNLDAAYPTATWTVTITPSSTLSINTFTTTGTGGTFSVNASTKVVTITGTRAQVNSRLSGLRIDANGNAVDFILTYFASNNVNAVTDSELQTLISQGLAILGAVSQPLIYYNEDTAFLLTGAPLITDIPFDGTGNYVYTITPNTTAAVSTASFAGTGGTISINSSTKVITIQGTRSQVNGRLSQITITPGVDYQQNFNFQYAVSTPRADTANKIQAVLIGSVDTEIINMNLNRNYTANNPNLIFATNTPQISDNDATNPTYTVIFNCAQGEWTYATNSSPYTESSISNPLQLSGSKEYINSRFAEIKFYPNSGVSANTTFTYTQIKNGVTQVNQSVGLIGSTGTYSGARNILLTFSQNFTPSVSDFRYGKIDSIFMVGGGGGGSGSGPNFGGGGGGGGGVRYSTTDILFQANTSYPIVIGAGGLGGNSLYDSTLGIWGKGGTDGGTTSAFGLSISGGVGPKTPYTTFQGTFQVASAVGGASGPQIGLTNDDNGRAGGTSAANSSNGTNAGGGGGHYSVNTSTGKNATSTRGGNGENGADRPGWENSVWGAGGGGGGSPTRGSANANAAGRGANPTEPATVPTSFPNSGGGGGGGFGSFPGTDGRPGIVIIAIASR